MNISNKMRISEEDIVRMGHKSEEKIRRFYFPKAIIQQRINKGSRILDVGCGYGHFLKVCDEYGLETYGIDISEYAIKQAKHNTNAHLLIHDVNKGLHIFRSNFFDVVTLFDVLEHLWCPYRVLREVHRVLKPKGRLIMTTPNLNSLMRFLKRDKWHGYHDKTHLYLFTLQSLKFLVERAGFYVIKIEAVFRPMALPQLFKKLLDKTNLGGEIWCIGIKT